MVRDNYNSLVTAGKRIDYTDKRYNLMIYGLRNYEMSHRINRSAEN